MLKTLHLKIITPNAVILDSNVNAVIARSVDGDVGILPDHIPLITPLSQAALFYKENELGNYAAVLGGLMEVKNKE